MKVGDPGVRFFEHRLLRRTLVRYNLIRLKAEIEKGTKSAKSLNLEALLLKGPLLQRSNWAQSLKTENQSTNLLFIFQLK